MFCLNCPDNISLLHWIVKTELWSLQYLWHENASSCSSTNPGNAKRDETESFHLKISDIKVTQISKVSCSVWNDRNSSEEGKKTVLGTTQEFSNSRNPTQNHKERSLENWLEDQTVFCKNFLEHWFTSETLFHEETSTEFVLRKVI